MTNEKGVRNFYFGHPFSKETYTNALTLKTPVSEWEADFDDVYSGAVINITPVDKVVANPESEVEHRVIRGTKVMFIGDYEKVLEMQGEFLLYKDLCNKATVKINNPDFLEFEAYTKKVLNDPLKNIFEMQSVTPEQAKKYMDYAVLYDKDKSYSDKLIEKPYFATCDEGVLILTEDFVDFNVDLRIDMELGVVGAQVQLSPNTSKYTHLYKDI